MTDAVFPVAGVYKAAAIIGKKQVPFSVQVKDSAEAPVVGAAAPTAPSPTPTATLGVDPICTRSPKCPLHDVSLSDVIGKQPVAVMFATPALVALLMIIFPISKLLHAPGLFFSPTRNQTDNARELRHVSAWTNALDKKA